MKPLRKKLVPATISLLMAGLITGLFQGTMASASERFFTYTYEPEAMPQGTTEFEQWVTLRAGRSSDVGQENYNRWDIREEFEYGATDRYTVSLYLNLKAENFRDPVTKSTVSDFDFDGVSLENRYMLWNPAEHPVGLSLYLEGTYVGEEGRKSLSPWGRG